MQLEQSNDGNDRGYDNGHINGYDTGYNDGYCDGCENGFDNGYDDGCDNGYDGYDYGYDDYGNYNGSDDNGYSNSTIYQWTTDGRPICNRCGEDGHKGFECYTFTEIPEDSGNDTAQQGTSSQQVEEPRTISQNRHIATVNAKRSYGQRLDILAALSINIDGEE